MKPLIAVLLADDHQMFRDTLARRLQEESDIRVVGTCGTADDAVELAIRHGPDVVVMDIDMPGQLCFDAARMIKMRTNGTAIVFLSAFSNDAYIDQALSLGAAGYVTKTESVEAVVDAVRAAANRSSYFSKDIRSRLVFDEAGMRLAADATSRAARLSDREREVLRHIARGLSRQQIAEAMHLSPATVRAHTSNIMDKLDIRDRVELARFAIREGLAEA